MLVAALVILAGVVVVASGRGGEMAVAEPDYPPIDLGPVSSADVALLRPPSAAWGYNMRVTDEALEVIAKAVTERDVQIATLQQEVSDLRDQLGGGSPAEGGRAAVLDPEPRGLAGGDSFGGDSLGDGPDLTEPETPVPARPADAQDTTAPGVPITRPQPIYRPGDQGDHAAGPDYAAGPGHATDREPETPTEGSAPWGPAELPEAE